MKYNSNRLRSITYLEECAAIGSACEFLAEHLEKALLNPEQTGTNEHYREKIKDRIDLLKKLHQECLGNDPGPQYPWQK